MTTKWIVPKQTKERIDTIKQLEKDLSKPGRPHFSRPILEALYNRGVRTVEGIDDIMDVSVDKENPPEILKDIEKAANVISKHIDADSKITVMGDYDADGVAATTIMVRGLRYAGANVDYFVNDRFKHGFGINKQAVIDMIAENGQPDLIITVDNGIVGFEGVQYAVDQGVEVVVTDHHLADKELPKASAVVNPQRHDDTSSFKEICGAAVAYKVMLMLFDQRILDFDYIYDMRDLVGMATVGDLMPLRNENRWFVVEALNLLDQGKRPQFEILRQIKQSKKAWGNSPDVFGYTICPMMNAPGRLLGVPDIAIDFFLTDDLGEMTDIAKQLVEINEERKNIARVQTDLAEQNVVADNENVLVVYHPDFKQGIIGLIAGRLTEKYNKPAIAFSDGPNGTLKGSARSVDAYPIKDALDRIAEYTVQHGGHDGAAGLTIEKSKLDAFTKALTQDASTLTPEDLSPEVKVDAVLHPSEISLELVQEMNRLEPFGEGFEKPLFGMSTLPVDDIQFMTGGLHAKIIGSGGLNVLMFDGGNHVRALGEVDIVQAVGSPSINEWRGKRSVQFIVHGNCLVGK